MHALLLSKLIFTPSHASDQCGVKLTDITTYQQQRGIRILMHPWDSNKMEQVGGI